MNTGLLRRCQRPVSDKTQIGGVCMKPFWVSLSRVAKGFRRDILIAAAILSIPFTMAAQTTDIKPDASNSDITYSASSAAPQPSDAPPQEEQYPTQSTGQGKFGVAMGPVNSDSTVRSC